MPSGHLKNVFWSLAVGGIGASLSRKAGKRGPAARVPATCPVEVLTKTEAFRRRRNLEPKSYF